MTYEQLDIFSAHALHASTPLKRILGACAWASVDYPRRWMKLVRLCEAEADRGSKCLRRGDLFLIAQLHGMSISVAKDYRFDNNIWAPLSRYLLMFRPRLAKIIHPQECALDSYDYVRLWHENVNGNTFFFAETWQKAQELYEDMV